MSTGPQYPNNFNWQNTYPPLFDSLGWAVPPTNSTQVATWWASINQTQIPPAPVIQFDAAGDPISPYPVGENPYCDWSLDGVCSRPGDTVRCPTKGVWGLTFDDGPTTFGSQLYDFLNTTQQKASLWYIGVQVAQNPQIAQKGCAAGHQIGIHTWSHHPLTSLTNEQIVAELKWTELIIKEVCGVTPRYFRPPYGDYDDRVRFIAESLGYLPVIWDLDTNDWEIGTPNSTVTTATEDADFVTWINEEPTDTQGHICLQHELTQITVNEAIKNLPALQAAYKVMPVASCINDRHPYLESILFPTMDNAALPPNSMPINQSAVSVSSISPSTSASGVGSNPSGASVSVAPASTGKSSAANRSKASSAVVLLALVAAVASLSL
ncbi:hypothetical protein BC937DRAFT_89192 [Endogone sp. FLAS-F59071]|nr:hypothetical protein BC937DRAFT_89192 [Endogone sp. FLAS-F59071]|eukprot:RUS18055.1 hypothetical protein BC937DRAFT_89192 [Endogone sp. FLAS-F59071]